MKIIRYGKVQPPPTVYHGQCPSCGVIAEFEPSETRWNESGRKFAHCPTPSCLYGIIGLKEGEYTGEEIKLPLRMAPETVLVNVDPTDIVSVPDDGANKVIF